MILCRSYLVLNRNVSVVTTIIKEEGREEEQIRASIAFYKRLLSKGVAVGDAVDLAFADLSDSDLEKVTKLLK